MQAPLLTSFADRQAALQPYPMHVVVALFVLLWVYMDRDFPCILSQKTPRVTLEDREQGSWRPEKDGGHCNET